MSRPLRIEYAGAHYHVIARGNRRDAIFVDDEDRQRFLMDVGRVAARVDWAVLAYCLMENHYHLLLRTNQPTLARGMRDINSAHSQRFNRRHGRVGHVLQGRYKAMLVEEAGYLFELARYIVLNPVRAGMCAAPGQWPWSSYAVTAGLAASSVEPPVTALIHHFGGVLEDARAAYVRFVDAGIGASAPRSAATTRAVVGSRRFEQEAAPRVAPVVHDVPRADRALMSVADAAAGAPTRNDAIARAHATGLFSLQEIGRCFGLSASMTGKIVRRRERELAIR
jgi:REP element-mobilizing transposase RayT